MTIVASRQINLLVPADVEDRIGNALCLQSMRHFTQFLGQRAIGYAYNACQAAVAIAANANYDPLAVNGLNFSASYGSSRLYRGLDPYFNQVQNPRCGPFSSSQREEHAEQTAIRTAINQGVAFWDHNGHHHIYIDLSPCSNCEPWLENRDEDWFVHYYTPVNNQQPVIQAKKRSRSEAFGRQMEPPIKKRRLN